MKMESHIFIITVQRDESQSTYFANFTSSREEYGAKEPQNNLITESDPSIFVDVRDNATHIVCVLENFWIFAVISGIFRHKTMTLSSNFDSP